jgi:hypothetical protein
MAKQPTDDRNEQRGISADELRRLQSEVRDAVLQRVRAVDPKAVGEFRINLRNAGANFSDWHDRFRDGGGFSDAWGKGGDLKAQLIQRVGPEDMPGVVVPDVIPDATVPKK